MTKPISSLDAILAPMSASAFRQGVLGKQPLHLEGDPGKWAGVMSWETLNRLLGMSSIWSAASLPLVLDKDPVPATAYTAPAVGRDGGQVLRPDPVKVQDYLRRGATLVANDIDQLTPELRAFSAAMEAGLGGKVQGNLYLSSKRKQGFRVHYDTHDVFAVHVMGEKTWFVFEGRAEAPIAHPLFKSQPQEHHDTAKGALWREIRLRAGDLLYLPRGQYHYALADDGACAHIAFGVTYPIGLDVVTYLFERMVGEGVARSNLPQGDPAALAARLRAIGERAFEILADATTQRDVDAFIRSFHYPRGEYHLPELIEAAEERWLVRATGVRLVEQAGRVGLVKTGSREAVEVPGALKAHITWVLARPAFTRRELSAAFAGDPASKHDRLLADLERMALIAAA